MSNETQGMTHEEVRDALDALALDALDISERDAVLEHLAGCAACRAEFVFIQATVADLAHAVTPLPMQPAQRDAIRGRLLARAAEASAGRPARMERDVERVVERVAERVAAPAAKAEDESWKTVVSITDAPSVRRRFAVPTWAAVAAGLIALASVAQTNRMRGERDAARELAQSSIAEKGARTASLDSLRATVADRDRLIANLTGPDVAVMTLAATGTKSPSARMFWDQSVNAWTFVAHNLPAPKPGRTYQLWLVTASAKISAGTFAPGANGDAVVRATFALPRNGLAAVAVTDEPSAGSEQPTTVPFIVGTAGSS